MKKVTRQAYAEVDDVLNFLPYTYKIKVPENLRNMFKEKRLPDYKLDINPAIPLVRQNLLYETRVILSIFKRDYWCTSEERIKLEEKIKKNSALNGVKYDFDSLVSKENAPNLNNVILPVEVKKKSWIQNLFEKIKHIFKK